MTKTITKLLLLLLAATLAFSLSACGKSGDDGSTDGGDGTNDTPSGDTGSDTEVDTDPENLTLIKDGKAKFTIVTTGETDETVIKAVNSFISDLSDLGVEIGDSISDSDASAVTDCEIVVGTGVKNRDAKFVLDLHDYGEKGYVIKIVDNKVLIGGGSAAQTKAAFEYFVKNVAKLTSKTKEMDNLKVERAYERLKKTEYIIEGITVSGTDLSEFVVVYELGEYGVNDFKSIESFRQTLYDASGYWLDVVKSDSVPEGTKRFNISYVADAGSDGFRAYVDSDGNFNVECAYANAFDLAFASFLNTNIIDKIGAVNFSKSFETTLPVSVVYYSQFGATDNGELDDDFLAIYNAHAFANQSGQKVMSDPGWTYRIYDIHDTAIIKTDVDWNGATFIIEDRGSEIYAQREKHAFAIKSDFTTRTFSVSEIKRLFGDKSVKAGDTSIPWLADYVDGTSFLILRNSHEDFIRWGGHIMSQNRQDIAIIEPDGTLHNDTPIIYDFAAGEQLVNTGRRCQVKEYDNFNLISIRRVDDSPITVSNGQFKRYSNSVVAETGFQNIYHAYSRGISITRSNVTINNIDHKILWEPDMPTSGYGQDADGKFMQGYPYGGFLVFSSCYNSKAIGCDLNAHTCFYEHKDSTANPTAMGTYDLNITSSCNIYIEGITNGVDHCDSQYWGIMHSNKSKNLNFKDCVMNRFDAHEGFWNASFDRCEFGFNINVIGGGHLRITDTTKCVGTSFISMRVDYGSTFNGTMEIINCTLKGQMGYRGGSTHPSYGKYYGADTDLYVISSTAGTESTYKGAFDPSNMQTFPYLKWDFGYQRYLPQHIVLDNFVCRATAETGAKLYLYPNYGDACFNKPMDFYQESDYKGILVDLPDGTTRPMTEDDVFYGPLMITQSIKFRNMEPIDICADKSSYLYLTLTNNATVEND